jgi:phosphoglycerate dehydrogenase-like enzyme
MDQFAGQLAQAIAESGIEVEPVVLSNEPGATLDSAEARRVELAFMSSDFLRGNSVGFWQCLRDATDLRWLHLFGVGVDERHAPLLERGVRITNSVGVNAEPIAQNALAGLLMLARNFPRWAELQSRRSWQPLNFDSPEAPRDLADETMVVIGLGAIGSRIAQLAKALDMKVIGVRRTPAAGDEPVDEMRHPSELDAVLPAADWLVLAPILTPETRGMIDARRLALMPKGARLINISRGAVVDEQALIDALAGGQLGGAYLDVFLQEPLPVESPLWSLPNVILTPHNAANSRGKFRREALLFLENLQRWGRQEPLTNEVVR